MRRCRRQVTGEGQKSPESEPGRYSNVAELFLESREGEISRADLNFFDPLPVNVYSHDSFMISTSNCLEVFQLPSFL
jgi:hypothetical protein